MRKWLKNDFYNTAFSKKERKAILNRKSSNSSDSEYAVKKAKATKDRIFALSWDEFWNYFWDWESSVYFKKKLNHYRFAKSTKYAEEKEKKEYGYTIDGAWWLRTAGKKIGIAFWVQKDKENKETKVKTYYGNATNVDIGVRPALYLDLTKSGWKKVGK